MALEVRQFSATIPAGTAKDSPHTADLDIDNRVLESIDLQVPPGPAGLMGFRVSNNGVPWIPREAGQWLIWDDAMVTWRLDGQPDASGWEVVGYNSDDFYDHTVVVRMHVNLPPAPPAPEEPTVSFTSEPAPLPVVAL